MGSGPASWRGLDLRVLPTELVVARLPAGSPVPDAIWSATDLVSVTVTSEEVSIICPRGELLPGAQVEAGWRAMKVLGRLELSLTGVLASLAGPLAAAGVSVFAMSTYDTDYLLVRHDALDVAVSVLRGVGHRFEHEG